MFTKALEDSLNSAFILAREKRHEFMTVEHLLLALLENTEARDVLIACGVDIDRLRTGLTIFIDETTPIISPDRDQQIQPTLGFQRVLQRAIFQVQSAGKTEVTGASVLSAIFGEQESQAVYFLTQENATRLDVVNYVSHGITKKQDDLDDEFNDPRHMEDDMQVDAPSRESALERYTINLNELAKEGKLDPLIGRENEISRTIQVLCRRRKNNPLLVGEAGVGKTAIAEGLAQLILNKKVPETIANNTIFSLDLGILLAGTKYRGDFEKRFKAVLKELKDFPGAIIFIDEIHTIIGAGAASGGTMDAANLLKPLLSGGEIRCVGSTTYKEFRSIFEKDSALSRRFQPIDISEPTTEETYEILKGLRERFEAYHHVHFSDEALKAASDLSDKYLHDRHLPDKAIDVVDEAGAHQHLLEKNQRKEMIDRKEIEEIVSKMANIPSQTVSSSDKEVLQTLDRNLKMLVYGQDHAITSMCDAIKLSRTGLRDEYKPIGSFLFAGPTGVGKTEVTRQLAKSLGVELIRFDMSEYMERHAVARLIGAPPGYVGYEEGGLLTEAVNKNPHAVLLLDEIEKAHPDIFNILLQVMDHGTLTDNNGRKADFKHVILIMTTNAGAQMLERSSIGFTTTVDSSDSQGEIKRLFAPEFRNRLDAVVQFHHLDESTIHKVVDKFITELEVQLDNKGVALVVDADARHWLAEHGYDRAMGARPMERLIQEHLKKPLADEILFGRLTAGGVVNVTAKAGKLAFEYKEPKSREIEMDA